MSGKVSKPIITDGLVLAVDAANKESYPGSGTSVYDISGNNHIGTLFNGVGVTNKSFTYDNVNDYIRVPNDSRLTQTTEFSISFWVLINNLDVATGNQLVSKGSGLGGVNNGWAVSYFSSNQSIYFDCYATSQRYARINSYSSANGINETGWNHIVGTFNNGVIKLYFNSVVKSSGAYSPFEIGGSENFNFDIGGVGSWRYHDGELSQILYYNRELSASEILQNYNATKARFGL